MSEPESSTITIEKSLNNRFDGIFEQRMFVVNVGNKKDNNN